MLPRSTTCRPSGVSLKRFFSTCFDEDRVDSGPRDRRPLREIQRTPCLHVTCKTEIVWEHSPTRRKYWEILHLNRAAPLFKHRVTVPQCYQGSTIPVGPPPTCLPRGAPHGHPHGPRDRVASCHVTAPLCASCAPCGPLGL